MLIRRKGFSLLVTIVVASMIMLSASILYTSAREELMITHNIIMHDRAKRAAHSGINHFAALKIAQDDLRRALGDQSEVVFLENESLTSRLFYTVKLIRVEDDDQSFVVESIGIYKKSEKVLSRHKARAVFRW